MAVVSNSISILDIIHQVHPWSINHLGYQEGESESIIRSSLRIYNIVDVVIALTLKSRVWLVFFERMILNKQMFNSLSSLLNDRLDSLPHSI